MGIEIKISNVETSDVSIGSTHAILGYPRNYVEAMTKKL